MFDTTKHLIFTHDDFIIINKPAGVAVQNETFQPGIIDSVREALNLPKLWLVHRLDKITSGLLILATNSEAAARLGALFSNRQMEKYYLAVSAQKPKKKQGLIIGEMLKARAGQWKLTQHTKRPAATQFFSKGLGNGRRLFVLKPYTGRTHQIRVALKSLGSPILGDKLYKGAPADRTYLHAYALRFTYAAEQICVTALPVTGDLFLDTTFGSSFAPFSSPWLLEWPALPASLISMPAPQSTTDA